MSTATQSTATSTASQATLLDEVIAATKQTEPDQVKDLLTTLTQNALNGTVTWERNTIKTLNNAIAAIDSAISEQLAVIMHEEQYNSLEGSWRGVQHLVKNSPTSNQLKIKLLNLSKKECRRDLEKAGEFDQSQLFKKIYENEFGMPGGEPYGVLLGDYQFGKHPEDISLLRDISGIAASAFCPFISAADSSLFGFDDWTELAKPRDLEKIFDSVEYSAWNTYRESEDSRFVALTMPRVIARLPYGELTKPIDAFNYELEDYSDFRKKESDDMMKSLNKFRESVGEEVEYFQEEEKIEERKLH